MKQNGFTLLELTVAIVIMGILFTISVVNMRGSQIDSRDRERSSDVENITRSLEGYYRNNLGRYPITTAMNTEAALSSTLSGISSASYRAPNVTNGSSLVVATNNIITTTGVLPQPTASTNHYVYQPIAGDGTLCTISTQECRTYNLYYFNEASSSVLVERGKNK